jgi:hypothetical protein
MARAALLETGNRHLRRRIVPVSGFLACLLSALHLPLASAGGIPAKAPQSAPPTPAQQQDSAIISLRVVPKHATLWGARASQRFVVLGMFADGLERDVTSQSRFSVSIPSLASLESAGRIVARADGELDLKAEVGKQTASAHVRIEGSKESRPFSFARDIGRILTQRGCNAVECHGSVKGQKGFKLSLNTLYPRDDYAWIVEGGIYQVLTTKQPKPRKPRIDRAKPEDSLLLLKATAAVRHGGRARFLEESADYRALVDWIKKGAPYGEDQAEQLARIVKLEIEPRQLVLDAKGKQQLLVTALLANGRREDMSDSVLYHSNNKEVAAVSPAGVVQAVRTGETAILVRAPGQVATVGVGVIAQPTANYPLVKGRNFIDDYVFAKLRKFWIAPAPISRDEEFFRRLCLDLTGTLPSPERLRGFVADRDPAKRDKLIEILLDSPQYVDFWAYRLADLLRVNHTALEQLKRTYLYQDWVRLAVAQNKPYDQIARERIAAQGYGGPTLHSYRVGDLIAPQELMAEEMRVFGGVRLECAQCHNHPFEAWSQDQFWGLAAFFGQLTTAGHDAMLIDFPNGEAGRNSGRTMTHPRTKQVVKPAFLDGTRATGGDPADLRMTLAKWLTAPDNPYFAKAAVNRMWGYFFGRGIVDPVDDFRASNPPTHPELLEALAQHFKQHHYDLKDLIRTIVQSRTYQLSGDINPTNRNDELNYSRSRPRPLEAVVLLDAISRVTGVDEKFDWDKFVGGGSTPPGTRAIELVPEIAPCRFLDVYGRPNRQTLPESHSQASLGQALHMLVGSTYTDKIAQKGGRVDRMIQSAVPNQQAIDELYLRALCRLPTERERTELDDLIRRQPSRRAALEALTWALISSREFVHNH